MKKHTFLTILSLLTVLLFSCNKGPKPTAAFSMDPAEPMAMDTVKFINESTDAMSYAWNFGDDSVSTEQSPKHVYRTGGTFTVTLTATGEGGVTETTKTLTVLPSLTGAWTSNFTYYFENQGSMELKQSRDGKLTGRLQLFVGSSFSPVSGNSNITGTNVVVNSDSQGATFSFKGTVNASYDMITGSLFVDGQHTGNWYAIKKRTK